MFGRAALWLGLPCSSPSPCSGRRCGTVAHGPWLLMAMAPAIAMGIPYPPRASKMARNVPAVGRRACSTQSTGASRFACTVLLQCCNAAPLLYSAWHAVTRTMRCLVPRCTHIEMTLSPPQPRSCKLGFAFAYYFRILASARPRSMHPTVSAGGDTVSRTQLLKCACDDA